MLHKFMARQLASPSYFFGRLLLAPLWNRRNKTLNDFALRHLDLQSDDRVLDIGFGGGYLIERMADVIDGGAVHGVDASIGLVKRAQSRFAKLPAETKPELKHAPVESLLFPDAHFTKVVSVNSIFYWTDPPKAFKEISRVLQNGGRFVLIMTDRASLENKGFAKEGLKLFDPAQIYTLFQDAGFTEPKGFRSSDRHRNFTGYVGIKNNSIHHKVY